MNWEAYYAIGDLLRLRILTHTEHFALVELLRKQAYAD